MDKNNSNKKRHVDMTSAIQQNREEKARQLVKKIENILRSDLSPYERKIAIFNVIKKLECMDEYKKTTVEAFRKLKLVWDKGSKYKLYQDFKQDEEFEEEEGDLVEFIEGLKKAGVPYREIAKGLKRSDRMMRYWRKPITKSLQRVGPKRRFDRKCLFHLLLSIQNKKAKTL
ncbi:14163_t:CDS:2, partial [Racocetra persica]